MLPAISEFFSLDKDTFAGYSFRGLELGPKKRTPLNDPKAPASEGKPSRCPTVTAQLLLLLLEFGIDDWSTLEEKAENFGLSINTGSLTQQKASTDLLAMRLLLSDNEISSVGAISSNTENAAGKLIQTLDCFGENADEISIKDAATEWINDLFASSKHGDASEAEASHVVFLGNLLTALTEWRSRLAGKRRATARIRVRMQDSTDSPSDPEAASLQLLRVADQRLFFLLDWIRHRDEISIDQWIDKPQGATYFASCLQSMDRLRQVIESDDHGARGVVKTSERFQCDSCKTLASEHSSDIIEWIVKTKARLKLKCEEWLTDYAKVDDDQAHARAAAASFYHLALTILSHIEVRDPRTVYHKVLDKIINAMLIERDEVSVFRQPGNEGCRLKFGDHVLPADSEVVFAILRSAYWPAPGPGKLLRRDLDRYKSAVKLGHAFIKALEEQQQLFYYRAERGIRSLVQFGQGTATPDLADAERASAWETYLTARVCFMGLRLAWALGRTEILSHYRATPGDNTRRKMLLKLTPSKWLSNVKNAEEHTKYSARLFERFIRPIVDQIVCRAVFPRPAEHGVSFILYGPPGSGKTHAVSVMAQELGWPLISLSPSNFIRYGADKMEELALQVFEDLGELYHAVVFFDECDEIFRSRSDQSAVSRNSLSFATASMLPKLQALSKRQRVIFVLATNYLQNIDDAVRRDGRFNDRLLVDRPHSGERLDHICNKILRPIFDDLKAHVRESSTAEHDGSTERSYSDDVKERITNLERLKALLSLLILRVTQGYSFSQTEEVAEVLIRELPGFSELCALPMLASTCDSFIDRSMKCILNGTEVVCTLQDIDSSQAVDPFGDDVLPLSLRMTWPVLEERQCYGLDSRREAPAAASGLGQLLLDVDAFNECATIPPTWPTKQVSDYMEWIVSRSDSELDAANVHPSIQIKLKTHWVSIPGFHTYMRTWMGRNVRA